MSNYYLPPQPGYPVGSRPLAGPNIPYGGPSANPYGYGAPTPAQSGFASPPAPRQPPRGPSPSYPPAPPAPEQYVIDGRVVTPVSSSTPQLIPGGPGEPMTSVRTILVQPPPPEVPDPDIGIEDLPLRSLAEKDIRMLQESDDSALKECMVCLDEFVIGNAVRTLPCFHNFHKDCIDKWFDDKNTCPICKTPAIKAKPPPPVEYKIVTQVIGVLPQQQAAANQQYLQSLQGQGGQAAAGVPVAAAGAGAVAQPPVAAGAASGNAGYGAGYGNQAAAQRYPNYGGQAGQGQYGQYGQQYGSSGGNPYGQQQGYGQGQQAQGQSYAECRSCGRGFYRRPGVDQYSAAYYRCERCTGGYI